MTTIRSRSGPAAQETEDEDELAIAIADLRELCPNLGPASLPLAMHPCQQAAFNSSLILRVVILRGKGEDASLLPVAYRSGESVALVSALP